MQVEPTSLQEVCRITPVRHEDERGFLSVLWNEARWREAGLAFVPVQHALIASPRPYTLRGLHFQAPPHAQRKLVCVLAGAIRDVAVDLRRSSADCGRHVAIDLDARRGEQLLIPSWCAHGFMTIEENTRILLSVDAPHAPEHASGFPWDDPAFGIAWGQGDGEPLLSDKDRQWLPFERSSAPFP